ncbi:hypothetical protein BLA29_001005, partial [Euroglyphus maynei]
PSKPKGPLNVSDVHAEGCKLKWNKPEDDGGEPILNYQIEKQDTETGRWVPVCTSREPEADITGLIPGHEYKFRVKAVNVEGESEPLESDHSTVAKNPFTEPDKPGRPQPVDWDRHHVDLKWQPPENDGGAPITGYIVEKKEKTGKNWIKALVVDGPINEARVPDLIEGVDYQFRVKALNKAGPSGPSDASEVVTTKPRNLLPKIEKVRDITVHAGQPIKFDVKVIGEPPPKTMWYRDGDDKPLSGNDGDLKIENEPYRTKLMVPKAKRCDTGLYKLVATNPSGTDEVQVKVTVLDKPGEPEGPLDVSDVHAEGCKLKWKPPKDDGGVPIETYVVEKQDQATGKWLPVCQTTIPEVNVSNLEPGHEYKFRVKAVNAEGESEPLVTLQPTLAKNPYEVPAAPGTPQVTDIDKNHVDLCWEPPSKDGGAPITGYIIEKKEKGSDKWMKACQVLTDETKARVPDLETGHEYQFRVKALNKAGASLPSDETKMVLVKHKKLPPKIDRKNLRPIKIKVGEEFVFDADVIGEPAPEVVWKLNDKDADGKANLTITNKPYNTRFECDKATRKDAGVYRVIATNKWGEDQVNIEVKVVGKPSKPNGPLQVDDIRKDGCSLKWNKPDDDGGEPLEGYLVEKLDPDTGSWIPVGKTLIPEINVHNLMPGKQYSFRVKAVNKEGESEPLETLSPIIAKDPYETPGQTGRPEPVDWNKDHVDLKWEPPANDGGAPIESYIIEKREKGSPRWVKSAEVPGDQTRGTAPHLEEGKEYEFRVTAVNKAGPGEPSEASKSVVAKPRFLAPRIDRSAFKDLTISAGQKIFYDVPVIGEPPPEITWNINGKTMPAEGDTHHKIDTEDYNTKLTARNATRADSGAYTITAINSSGRDTVTVQVLVTDKPTAPEGPLEVKDVHKEGCKLGWKKPKDDGGIPLDGYLVEKMDTDSGLWVPVAKTKATNMEVTGLVPGKEYKFRVSAVNKEGESEPLETLKPILAKNPFDEPGKTGKPQVIDWDENHADLQWEPPKEDGGAPIEKYIIEKRNKHGGDWEKATEVSAGGTNSATVPDLIEGQQYEFRVRAVNKAGPGEPSEPSDAIVAKPRRLPPKIDRTNLQKIKLKAGQAFNFDVNVSGEPAPETEWLLKDLPVKTGGNVKVQHEPYNTKLNVRQATRAHSGIYTVKAVNKFGEDEAQVEVIVIDRPAPPGGPLRIEDVHAEGATLKWRPPDDDGGLPIDHYVVEKMDPTTGIWTSAAETIGAETSVDVKGLTPGKKYKFRVKAVNRQGDSDPLNADKEIIAKNPFDAPGKPHQPDIADYDTDFVQLKWKKPDDDGGAPITGYIIEKKDKYSNDWTPAAEIDGDITTGRVDNLIEGQQYEFRVRAVNKG